MAEDIKQEIAFPKGCQWLEDRKKVGEYRPDYCLLGPALKEQLQARAKDVKRIAELEYVVACARTAVRRQDSAGYMVLTQAVAELGEDAE